MTEIEQDLQTMRLAAEQRDWITSQDTFKRLIANLDPLIALQIAATRTQAFLPTFEMYYPEARWLRDLMLTVVSYASAPNELPVNALNQFLSPGCGNFVMAVFDLARAVEQEYTVFERYSHITNCVANAILAEMQHLYYSEHGREYTLMIAPATDNETKSLIQSRFWLDKKVARLDTARWRQVADQVEAKLEAGGIA